MTTVNRGPASRQMVPASPGPVQNMNYQSQNVCAPAPQVPSGANVQMQSNYDRSSNPSTLLPHMQHNQHMPNAQTNGGLFDLCLYLIQTSYDFSSSQRNAK